MSGVTVATTMRSMSSAVMPRRRSASWAALEARKEQPVPLSTIRRSLMPERSRIHSSEVSTILSRSSFDSTRSGR